MPTRFARVAAFILLPTALGVVLGIAWVAADAPPPKPANVSAAPALRHAVWP